MLNNYILQNIYPKNFKVSCSKFKNPELLKSNALYKNLIFITNVNVYKRAFSSMKVSLFIRPDNQKAISKYKGFSKSSYIKIFLNSLDEKYTFITGSSNIDGAAHTLICFCVFMSIFFTSNFFKFLARLVTPRNIPIFLFDIMKRISRPVVMAGNEPKPSLTGKIDFDGSMLFDIKKALVDFNYWAKIFSKVNGFTTYLEPIKGKYVLSQALKNLLQDTANQIVDEESLFEEAISILSDLPIHYKWPIPYICFSMSDIESNTIGIHRYRDTRVSDYYLTTVDLCTSIVDDNTSFAHLVYLKLFSPKFILNGKGLPRGGLVKNFVGDVSVQLKDADAAIIIKTWISLKVAESPEGVRSGNRNSTRRNSSRTSIRFDNAGTLDTNPSETPSSVQNTSNQNRTFSTTISHLNEKQQAYSDFSGANIQMSTGLMLIAGSNRIITFQEYDRIVSRPLGALHLLDLVRSMA